jgi:hypothetical protein
MPPDRFTLSVEVGTTGLVDAADVGCMLQTIGQVLVATGMPDGPRPIRNADGQVVGYFGPGETE